MFAFMQKSCDLFRALPCPTFSFIHGPAFGGGSELTTWSDFRIASAAPATKIAFVHKHMALTPSWHGGVNLKEHVGAHLALKYQMTGFPMSAEDLHPHYVTEIAKEGVEHAQEFNYIKYFGKNPQHTQALKQSVTAPREQQPGICAPLLGSAANIQAIEDNIEKLKK